MSHSRPLKHAFKGQLFTPDGTAFRVSISHTDEDIMLNVLGDASPLAAQPLDDILLESIGGRGILRTRGSGEFVDQNLIEFTLADEADVVQRREFVRITAPERVILEDHEGNKLVDTYAVNVSGGGVLISLPEEMTVDLEGTVKFSFYMAEEEDPVKGAGKVVRTAADNEVAIVFQEISRRDRERLIKFIFDRQRVALAVTRGDAI